MAPERGQIGIWVWILLDILSSGERLNARSVVVVGAGTCTRGFNLHDFGCNDIDGLLL